MPDPDLDYVDQQIAAALKRIAKQRGVIERVKALHVDTHRSERALRSMEQILGDLRAIRRLIEDDLTEVKRPRRY